MKYPILILSFTCFGCTTTESLPMDSAADPAMRPMGEIRGVVTRSAELQGDGIGNIIIVAFYGTQPSQERSPHNVLVLPYEDLGPPGTEIPYRLYNLFPEPLPYSVLAIFDEDNSLLESMNWSPTEGDLISSAMDSNEAPEVLVGVDGCPLDLELSVVHRE